MAWELSGSHYEACNCEAVCPCRRHGDRRLEIFGSEGWGSSPSGRATRNPCERAGLRLSPAEFDRL